MSSCFCLLANLLTSVSRGFCTGLGLHSTRKAFPSVDCSGISKTRGRIKGFGFLGRSFLQSGAKAHRQLRVDLLKNPDRRFLRRSNEARKDIYFGIEFVLERSRFDRRVEIKVLAQRLNGALLKVGQVRSKSSGLSHFRFSVQQHRGKPQRDP
jgi:hypothetical protein